MAYTILALEAYALCSQVERGSCWNVLLIALPVSVVIKAAVSLLPVQFVAVVLASSSY